MSAMHHPGAVRVRCLLASLAALTMLASQFVSAQPPRPGAMPAASPRAAAPFDMTGYWVSIVNEDWRWRMVTPPKGDYTSLNMLNQAGRAEADKWEPAQDGSCKAYGAAGLMRMPTRLHITWDSDQVMKIETDAGEQTRQLRFTAGASATGAPTLQGYSVAEWVPTPGQRAAAGAPPAGGSLNVTTTNLAPGWLRRNGVPYSDRTTLTEFFDQFAAPDGAVWLVVTTIVDDPVYLNDQFITSSQFRREPNDRNWNPKSCRIDR
jgi:hypothetical protein